MAFEVDAQLVGELGERLVARRSVALSELIKNAYDADATRAVVSLSNVTKPSGIITVEDNGSGMTLSEFQHGWMRIGTTKKAIRTTSERFGRVVTGSKGIGRVASQRLATRLRLESISQKPRHRLEQITAEIDWGRFRAGANVETVLVPFERKFAPKGAKTGTRLSLIGVRDIWTDQDMQDLQRDLVTLVSPFPDETRIRTAARSARDPGFSLEIVAPEFPKYEGPLKKQFLAAAWGKLRGRVDREGRVRYSLVVRNGPSLSFRPDKRLVTLGPVAYEVWFFIYRADLFNIAGFGVPEAREVGRERGGVRIYLDKFRVFPYGDPTDDWLGLDSDRARRIGKVPDILRDEARGVNSQRAMLALPQNTNLFGAVKLSREDNPNLLINISRERLVENEAFKELRDFVRLGIDWMTVQYVRLGLKRTGTSLRKRRSLRVIDAIQQARAMVGEDRSIRPHLRARLRTILGEARDTVERAETDRIQELTLLRILASSGNMILIFNHEVSALTG